jgi:tetratricopeptide (TPR) repeat protein
MTSSSVPGITGAPDTSSSSSAPALDQAKVGELMAKITANPKDIASYNALASLYFQAGDYKNSALFSQKAVALDPKADVAWVALGAAQFNQGTVADAKTSWLKAIAVNPKNAEAHYDLGFLYLSGDKPDTAKAKAEWQKVIDIDPKSDLAKTVQTHLTSLASPSPSASNGS